jgi:hypothetical protein
MQLMDYEGRLAIQELLRDLGWLPSDLNCEEKKRLAEEYLDATAAWSQVGRGPVQASREWLRQAHTGSRRRMPPLEGWKALRPALEEARLKAARARLALEAHIGAHKC